MTDKYCANLFIVAAPSGGGKTSLVNQLLKNVEGMDVSISHTTRSKRPGEKHGVDYYFVSEQEFLHMIKGNKFVENARVFDNFYGTSMAQIHERLSAGTDVVLDIDWQGAQQIKRNFPDAVSIFIIPPSIQALKERLTARKQDDEGIIHDRMTRARAELSHYDEFDYLIVNDEFEKAANDLALIVRAQRLRTARQSMRQRKLLSFLFSSD